MSIEDPVIALDHVSKAFRRQNGREEFLAVDRLSFTIKRGEIVAVLGQTGCGKSTVFNLIAGLIEPSSGTIRVLGHNAFREFDFFRGKIGIVFQGDRLMPWRTAIDNVLLGLEILNTDPRSANETARSWLSRLGLSGHENDYPHALSGGMRQRVSIARAFAIDPEILLCDEPFSALDEKTAGDLRTEFSRLVRQNNKTAVFVTHSINEALQIGDRILVFHRPARIALEENLTGPEKSGAGGAESESIRQRILDALTAGE
jgi:NitT/TauT family transport system ATP-binding protein